MRQREAELVARWTAGAWRGHGHAGDARYNSVVLHAFLQVTGGERETRLASGACAPVVVPCAPELPVRGARPLVWPCAGLRSRLGPVGMRALLEAAGQQRFEELLCVVACAR